MRSNSTRTSISKRVITQYSSAPSTAFDVKPSGQCVYSFRVAAQASGTNSRIQCVLAFAKRCASNRNTKRLHMYRPALVLIGLYLASLVILLIGYDRGVLGLSGLPAAQEVIRVVPVLRLAVLMTLICPAILLTAFWESRGDAGRYQNAALGWSILIPLPILLLLLPPQQARDDVKLVNFEAFFGLVMLSQGIAARLLRDWVWVRGRPRQAATD